jgi:anti-sigma regulatory factor (Ser/Thr protein kinase)
MEVSLRGLADAPAAGAALVVSDPTHVGEARRAVTALGQRLGLDETFLGRLAIVATELAANLVKHAGSGQVVVRPLADHGTLGFELAALDRGPGIADVARSLQDGYSTSGTAGTGLGAIRRLSDEFDVYSASGRGTAVLSRLWVGGTPPSHRLQVGAICVPKPRETVAGDGWEVAHRPDGARVVVVDGLGHGPDAHRAAVAALTAAASEAGLPGSVVDACHYALRSTRGAALAVADVDLEQGRVRFAGLGNVAGGVLGTARRQNFVSLNGTAGHGSVRVREFEYAWPSRGLLVLATDGLASRWSLDDYPGLAVRHPALVAAVLYRDHARGNDDVTVVVLRERESGHECAP